MDKPFLKAYVGFYYQRRGYFYYSLVPAVKAGLEWKRLVERGCEVIYTVDLEEHEKIKAFLVRGANFADEVWPKLVIGHPEPYY